MPFCQVDYRYLVFCPTCGKIGRHYGRWKVKKGKRGDWKKGYHWQNLCTYCGSVVEIKRIEEPDENYGY